MVRCLLVLCFIAVQSFGQQIKFENFNTNQGLSNNSVIDIENDKDGGLWIATWDGLNYYDGYSFKIFKHNLNDEKSISNNYITNLEKDEAGFIWLISKEGDVNRYKGNDEFEKFKFKELPKNIFLSPKGNVVVQTNTSYQEFKNGSFVQVSYNSIKKNKINELKNILLNEYPNLVINDVLKDKSGNIWYATRANGIYIISNDATNNKINHFSADLYLPYSLSSDEIEKLHEDVFGNVWIGQKDGGLSMAYTGSEKINSIEPHPVKQPYLPTETIRAITKDANGKTWLGYYTNGLYCYNKKNQRYEKFKIKESNINADWNRIRSLFTASDGTIWAGTYAGILRISGNEYVSYEAKNIKELPNNRSYSIYEDSNKQLWIACWGGVAKFNLKTEKFETFKGQKLLDKYHVRCIKKNNQDLIIATEKNGVVIVDLQTNKLKKITTQQGLLGNSIYSILIDNKNDNYWIASLGGITVFNKEKGLIKNITEEDGLPSHMVYGLIHNGSKVWVSTTKGIALIEENNYKVTSFNPKFGWQGAEFSEGSYYQDNKGLLYFGGVNGLNYFNPNRIVANDLKAKIKLKIDGNENYLPEIEKSFGNNDLTIEVDPIVFPTTDKKNIYFKLEGRDKNWILLSDNRKLEYTNLNSGTYTFLIKEGKQGNVQPVFFTLKIAKAFYETIFFYILLMFFVALACVLLIYFKNKTAKKQNKILEDQINARTIIIENQKKDLELINQQLDRQNQKVIEQKEKLLKLHSNLKNENFEIENFKTYMLAEFQDPLSQIIKISNAQKKGNQIQGDLQVQSNKLLNLISGWNYLSHVKDIGPIKKVTVNLFPVLKNSVEKLKRDLQKSKVNFNCEIDNSECFATIDPLRFKLLLQYFFNDINKYSDSDTTIIVEIGYENNFLKIKVISNSIILKNNWYNILHYSPYFKALQVLLGDLNGSFWDNSNDNFEIILKIPLETIGADSKNKETISWKHFNNQEQYLSDKKNIIVLCDQLSYPAANQVLENENYNIIFEDTVANLNYILKQTTISALILYQPTFSKELNQFLDLNKKIDTPKIPMIYISENINYEMQEQLVELSVDTFIQLPASTSFIAKKINFLIDKNKEVTQESKIHKKLFEILTEEDPIATPNDKLIKRALEIIKEQLQDPSFNVEILVEKLEISRVKCYRIFKETLHQSPSDIITSLRLQKAEVLLKTKKLNISEISFECGYNDPKYFARSFKKYFGKSPKEFKEQIVNELC